MFSKCRAGRVLGIGQRARVTAGLACGLTLCGVCSLQCLVSVKGGDLAPKHHGTIYRGVFIDKMAPRSLGGASPMSLLAKCKPRKPGPRVRWHWAASVE